MDTQTPRTPTGGRSPGFDDEPLLTMAKVPCDPAQVVVSHASFRVQLARPVPSRVVADAVRLDAVPGARRRRAPVVWSGRTVPGGDPAAQLLQAVRQSGRTWGAGPGPDDETGTTQVLPRVTLDDPPTTVIAPRPGPDRAAGHPPPGRLPAARGGSGRAGQPYGGYGPGGAWDGGPGPGGRPDAPRGGDRSAERPGVAAAHDRADAEQGTGRRPRRGAPAPAGVRHAYYPGRRMNLGIVLLPMRIFLGLISVYAGMGKLSDPVYFDGGERGSMVTWLQSLDPWPVAEPLRDFALGHPVGAGLTVAFLQVVVGVLTVMGLWQRVAAAIGALLSAALIVTVSWRTVPAYDAPDIIYLAAWSPLIIAGAPVYSMDARLAGEAWRRLGPRVGLWDLRRRVLRRGATLAAVVAGVTLLFGSMLGGAVRSSQTVNSPGHEELPSNHLPGSPLPRTSGGGTERPTTGSGRPGGPAAPGARSARPTAPTTPASPGAVRESATAGSTADPGTLPSRTQGATQGTRRQPPPRPALPEATAGPSASGGAGAATGGTAGVTGEGAGTASSGGASTGSGSGGALGGLLG
ncbi:DoxX family membrane protein [Streptomyces sp. NPDC018031]|uniref:DoxX family membrane protein n=1 Tax=Streptomyces sp. NPDC018031 TaxID=3365033 RepID=UPI0037A2762A